MAEKRNLHIVVNLRLRVGNKIPVNYRKFTNFFSQCWQGAVNKEATMRYYTQHFIPRYKNSFIRTGL